MEIDNKNPFPKPKDKNPLLTYLIGAFFLWMAWELVVSDFFKTPTKSNTKKNYPRYKKEDIWPDSDCDEIWNFSDCIDNGCFWENTGDGDGFCMPSGIFN